MHDPTQRVENRLGHGLRQRRMGVDRQARVDALRLALGVSDTASPGVLRAYYQSRIDAWSGDRPVMLDNGYASALNTAALALVVANDLSVGGLGRCFRDPGASDDALD